MIHRKINFVPLVSALFFTIISFVSASGDSIYNLTDDWSNSMNPNGVWSVNAGTSSLSHFEDLSTTGIDPWVNTQPGFSGLTEFGDITPVWFKSTGPLGYPVVTDWEDGDIVTHTSRWFVPNSNVTWTSDLNGKIDVLGSVWAVREYGRSNHWDLYLNGDQLTGGIVESGDPYDRSSPFFFELGSGGPGVLRSIPINVGDVIKLEFNQLYGFGEDYVGVDLRIVGTPAATKKSECKNNGWQIFNFKNQGSCIRFVNTDKDNRN
jgi:hypothetical protein